MVYDGYFTFGGTELINAERTKAYARHGMPLFGLTDECCDCPSLDQVAGDADGYSSPMSDPAPWYSPFSPGSEEFYGFLPLSVEGVDDGTGGATITELTTDGAVISRPRKSARVMRFSGVLLGASRKGLDVGMAWMKSVLDGSECGAGDCGGDELCYLATCPQVCSYEDFPTVVVDMPQDQVPASGWELGQGTRFEAVASVGERTFTSTLDAPSMSLRMDDLVPGAVYRVQVSVSSHQKFPVVISVPGSTPHSYTVWPSPVDQNTHYGPMPQPGDGGMGVFEFTAGSSVQRLVITGNAGDHVTVDRLRVERLPARSLVLSTSPASGNTAESGAWNATGGGGLLLERAYGLAQVTGTAIVDGLNSVPANVPNLSRTLNGLLPGARYQVTAAVLTFTRPDQNPVTTGTDRGVRMTLDTGESTNAPVVWGLGPSSADGYMGWVQMTFQAESRSHTLTIGPDLPTVLHSGGGYSRIEVAYLRVEDLLLGVPIDDPDPALSDRRHLRNVTAVSGPTVTGQFDTTVGAMQQIEFTLVAGDPQPLGDPRQISTILGPGVTVVPEVECSLNEPVLVNHLTHGSFELPDAGPWAFTTYGTVTGTFASGVVAAQAIAGTDVGQFTVTGAGTGELRLSTSLTGVPASTYIASVYVRATDTITATLGVGFTAVDGPTSSLVIPGGEGWQRVSLTYNALTAGTLLRLSLTNPDGWQTGTLVDVDGFMLVDGARLGEYFDGSTRFGTWSGTPFASTSTYRRTGTPLVVDPDCVPIPAPPRPPEIVNECIEVPDRWRRYFATIPAQVTAASPWSLPTVSITSGAVAVRGVRLRMVANPMQLPVEMLDPCSFCGEFIVTYLPANTTLTLDVAGRAATMSVDGDEPVSAMHLMYGSGGAPVVWPVLTCGIEYVALIDVDVDTPGALVGMELSVTPAY